MVVLESAPLLGQASYHFNKLPAHLFSLCGVLPPTSQLCKLLPVHEAARQRWLQPFACCRGRVVRLSGGRLKGIMPRESGFRSREFLFNPPCFSALCSTPAFPQQSTAWRHFSAVKSSVQRGFDSPDAG